MFCHRERLPQEIECYRETRDQFRQIGFYSREDKVEEDNEFLSVTGTTCLYKLCFSLEIVREIGRITCKEMRVLLNLRKIFYLIFRI